MNDKLNKNEAFCNIKTSRRGFLRASAAVGVAMGTSDSGNSKTQAVEKKLPKSEALMIAGYKLDRVEALIDGRVKVDGFDTQFEIASIGEMNTHVFSGAKTRAITEIGLSPFMLAYTNEGYRDYTLIPVFPLRMFRHKSIFIRPDSGIKSPEDLKGKKIATPGYSSTSLTWIRGFVQHEYGVKPNEIQWVIASKDSSANLSGGASAQEGIMPKGLSFIDGPVGKDESDMLIDGDVDALFHAVEPKAFRQGNPNVVRLFSNVREVEQDYFAKTGIFPIMHAVAIRKDIIATNPSLPRAVFNAYSQAKKLAYDYLNKHAWYAMTLPWVGQEIEETRALMGKNYWPYGIEPNRKALNALFQYSYEQGLANKKLTIEELFHPSTLELIE